MTKWISTHTFRGKVSKDEIAWTGNGTKKRCINIEGENGDVVIIDITELQ